jgi:hypothetical protein
MVGPRIEAVKASIIRKAFKEAADETAIKLGNGMSSHDVLKGIRESSPDFSPDELLRLQAGILIGAAVSAFDNQLPGFGRTREVCIWALFQELHLPPEKARKLVNLAINKKPETQVELEDTFEKALVLAKKKQESKKIPTRL